MALATPLASSNASRRPVEQRDETPVKASAEGDQQPTPASAQSDGGTRPIIAYVPASLMERLRQRRLHDRVTYTDIALDAVEATYHRLPELLAPYRPAAHTGSLFVRSGKATSFTQEPHVQVNLRFSAQNLEVLDRLTEELAAPNRSVLIATALDNYLE